MPYISMLCCSLQVSKLCTVARALPDGRTEAMCKDLFMELKGNAVVSFSSFICRCDVKWM